MRSGDVHSTEKLVTHSCFVLHMHVYSGGAGGGGIANTQPVVIIAVCATVLSSLQIVISIVTSLTQHLALYCVDD